MNSINSNFSTSFFRHFAAALSAPGGKTVSGNEAGNEGRGENSISKFVSTVRDKLTLSHEGRVALQTYANTKTYTNTNKLNKTEQSTPATQTQTPEVVDTKPESSPAPVSQSDLNTKYSYSYHQTPHHTGTHMERYELDLIARYNVVGETYFLDKTVTKNADGAPILGQFKTLRAGDSGLTEAQEKAIHQNAFMKAQALHRAAAVNMQDYIIIDDAPYHPDGTQFVLVGGGGGLAEYNKHNDFTEDLLGIANDQLYKVSKDAEKSQAYAQTAQDTKAAISEKIGQMLADSNLTLDANETLNLNVSLNGTISVGDGIADKEKAAMIEQTLNADATLGRTLLLNHAQQGLTSSKSFDTDAVYTRIIANEVLRNETGLSIEDIGFDATTISFYDKTGQHDIDGTLARDYTVMQGLFNSFSWNGGAYEHADPLSISFQISL